MTTHAKRERKALAEVLEAAGPDAPTLCGGWTTRDLAAHVVVRERRGEAAGILLPALAPRLERVRREFAERPYTELLDLIRTGPPAWSPFALKQVDEASNPVEFFVHTEDVRRADPATAPRDLDPLLAETLWKRLERMARLLARRSPVGLVLRRPDGRTVVARRATPTITLTGDPAELLLFTYGRQHAARVEAEGDKDAVASAYEAALGF
ncbi:TIGR03085 family metal-binding protein [Streptomyces polyrhachis]|uniref:TIGR03085 family metal-binding protein n=1 Tax=Streptomyces polyrhachis TaxID=1282885 RepID=A0ABW2GB60_9ACTN